MTLKTRITASLFISACMVGAAPHSATANDLLGTWLSQSGETRVRIQPCGSSFCGIIVWTQGNKKDENNPDESKRTRSLNGTQMIYNLKPTSDGVYSGTLYNYTNGKTYTGKATVNGSKLQVSGCVLGGLICQSQMWSRVN